MSSSLEKKRTMIKFECMFKKEYFIIFYIVFAAFFVWWIPVPLRDDIYFMKNDISFLYDRYMHWSSRIFIEAILPGLCRNPVIFKVITFLLIAILPYLMSKVICREEKIYFAYGIAFLYSFFPMSTAGWTATFVNYYYPLFALFLSLYLLEYRYNNIVFVVIMASVLFCTNQEQVCIIFIFFMAMKIYLGERDRRIIYIFLLAIIMLLFIISAPGNKSRFYSEIQTWFPEYIAFSLLHKMYLGFSSTLFNYILVPNQISIFLLFSLFINKYKTLGESLARIMIVLFALVCHKIIIGSSHIAVIKEYSVYMQNMSQLGSLAGGYLIFAIFCCIYFVYQCFSVLECKKLRATVLMILFAGLVSRFIMGMSPTIFVSGERTFLFCDFAFLAVALLFFSRSQIKHKNYIIWGAIAMQLMLQYGKFA